MSKVEWDRVLKEAEDHLFPRLHLTIRQRALYYNLLRRTRLVGVERSVFGLAPAAKTLDIAQTTVRKDLRELEGKAPSESKHDLVLATSCVSYFLMKSTA